MNLSGVTILRMFNYGLQYKKIQEEQEKIVNFFNK